MARPAFLQFLAYLGSQAKIYEDFANYFFKTKANNKCTCKGLQKNISELER